jgi:hypothetical protein
LIGPTGAQLALFQGVFASFPADFVLRQSIGGSNLNWFILKQCAVLPEETVRGQADWITPRVVELLYSTMALTAFAKDCGWDCRPFPWNESRRQQIRCELDAAFFHLYEINHGDVDYIMETFPIVKKKDIAEHGTYRTKERILEIYDEMATCRAEGTSWESPLNPPPGDARATHNYEPTTES